MVKLRLTRTGKKNAPHYRIIAIQARTKRDGEALEYLGYYNPRTKPSTITLKKDRIEFWLKQGAVPTSTVMNLLIREKVVVNSKKKRVFASKPNEKSVERTKAKAEKKEKNTEAEKTSKTAPSKESEEPKVEVNEVSEPKTEKAEK